MLELLSGETVTCVNPGRIQITARYEIQFQQSSEDTWIEYKWEDDTRNHKVTGHFPAPLMTLLHRDQERNQTSDPLSSLLFNVVLQKALEDNNPRGEK